MMNLHLNPGQTLETTTRVTVGKDSSRSIINVIQELHLKIQSFGPGPYTPEQSIELDKIKALYIKAQQEYEKQLKAFELANSMASSSSQQISNSSVSTVPSSQPISLVGTVGLVQNVPQPLTQNMSILQNQLTPHQLAVLQAQQRSSPQQVGGVRPVVNVLGNQQAVATLQNVQVLGSATHQQDAIGNLPINIITTGGQTYVTSNMQAGGTPTHGGVVPTQMHIRSIAPNAAAVVNQIQASQQLAQHQVRGSIQQQQQRVASAGKAVTNFRRTPNAVTNSPAASGKQVQQVNLTLPLQTNTQNQTTSSTSAASHSQILTKRKLQDLLHEIDPTETMDDDVEEIMLQIADDFIENVISSSCQIAKHRKSNTLEVKDVQLHLDRNWNMWIPGYGSEDLRPYKKLPATEAHRQRLALIKKAMKK